MIEFFPQGSRWAKDYRELSNRYNIEVVGLAYKITPEMIQAFAVVIGPDGILEFVDATKIRFRQVLSS